MKIAWVDAQFVTEKNAKLWGYFSTEFFFSSDEFLWFGDWSGIGLPTWIIYSHWVTLGNETMQQIDRDLEGCDVP